MRTITLVIAMGACVSCGTGENPEKAQAPPVQAAAPQAAAAASFEPCSLLTAGEVESAVGWKVAETRPIPQGSIGHCLYRGSGTGAQGLQEVDAGIGVCFANMPCGSGLPGFSSSADFAAYRRQGYESSSTSDLLGLKPTIEPLEGLGVPAIRHELAGQRSIEMALGPQKLAYVTHWGSFDAAQTLAKILLMRLNL